MLVFLGLNELDQHLHLIGFGRSLRGLKNRRNLSHGGTQVIVRRGSKLVVLEQR